MAGMAVMPEQSWKWGTHVWCKNIFCRAPPLFCLNKYNLSFCQFLFCCSTYGTPPRAQPFVKLGGHVPLSRVLCGRRRCWGLPWTTLDWALILLAGVGAVRRIPPIRKWSLCLYTRDFGLALLSDIFILLFQIYLPESTIWGATPDDHCMPVLLDYTCACWTEL